METIGFVILMAILSTSAIFMLMYLDGRFSKRLGINDLRPEKIPPPPPRPKKVTTKPFVDLGKAASNMGVSMENVAEAFKLLGSLSYEHKFMLDWFDDNYKETRDVIIYLIEQAVIKHSITIEQIYEGCNMLRDDMFVFSSLKSHIDLLTVLSDNGINASIAGKKIREALIDTEELNKKKAN